MNYGRFRPSALVVLVALWLNPLPVAGQLRLEKVGTTDRPDRISFAGIGLEDGLHNSQYATNPIITGDNLYAPDLVRNGSGWHCYYGGWKTTGQLYDRIYLATTPDREVGQPWQEQMIISNGPYEHVNDPTVVRSGDDWIMLYTAARWIGSGESRRYRDWINYSTSIDGIQWTPNEGSLSTEIAMSDPLNLLQGQIFSDIARPSLIHDGTKWKLWFDARVNGGPIESYLAESLHLFPSDFQLVHKYPTTANFPGFMEPDVARRPNGSYIAVIQRGFKKLLYGTSTDGVNFSLQEVVDADHPFFVRKYISNPGLVYDQESDKLLGFSFGMTDNDGLTDHDIGFSAMHYQVQVRSPGDVWHQFSEAHSLDEIAVRVFDFTSFDTVVVRNSATGQVVLQQPFTEAQPGDLWRLTDSSAVADWLCY